MSEPRKGRRGQGRGRGRGRGVGRPRRLPKIDSVSNDIQGVAEIELSKIDREILRLLDIEHFTQEQVAEKLEVSRATIWRYIKATRKKIAEAVISATEIKIHHET
ncbi:MAG: DUF134 domain-containing protein [Candidatus Heimdallarchaeota archaeon]|nr:DUF134 domain-containing protein [Candidatus Heimdallarchaeota archaeon]